eukprot:g5205.t1
MGELDLTEEEIERKMDLNRIGIHTFVARPPIDKHHSFIVGCDTFGLSARLEEKPVDENLTLKKLREVIEINKVNGMCRRPPLFCEVVYLMNIASNPFMYPEKRKLTEYRFGVSPKRSLAAYDLPYIIPKHLEKDILCLKCPVVEAYPTVIIVPVTQVNPMTDQVKGWKARSAEEYNNFVFPPKVDEVKVAEEKKKKEKEDEEEKQLLEEDAKEKEEKEAERKKRAERRRQKKLMKLKNQMKKR